MSAFKSYAFCALILTLSIQISATDSDCDKEIKPEVYRYLDIVRPLKYFVQLDVNPRVSETQFSGLVFMDLLVMQSTKLISFHSKSLEIRRNGVKMSLRPEGSPETDFRSLAEFPETADIDPHQGMESFTPIDWEFDYGPELVTLRFDREVYPGRYLLTIKYVGWISDEPKGLYKTTYQGDDGETRWLLLTNLMPTYARKVFPCRDEPDMKSEIYHSVRLIDDATVLSSFPLHDINRMGRNFEMQERSNAVANTSTYQFNAAFFPDMQNAVRPKMNKVFSTWAKESSLKSTNFAQDVRAKAMAVMEHYTQVPYPLETIVNLVIPGESKGVSSSGFGMITTKENVILYEDNLGPKRKFKVALNAAKEVSYQWFGQLLSPASWKFSWLSEGLTTHMKYYIINKIFPSWRVNEAFLVREYQVGISNLDTESESRALNGNSSTDAECIMDHYNDKSSIGGSIIRMMSHVLGENNFRAGMISYIKQNKFGAVTPDDLWEGMQRAVPFSESTINVKEMMNSWAEEKSYPVVTAIRNYNTGSLVLTQTPADVFFDKADDRPGQWWIPINYATQSSLNFTSTQPTYWLAPHKINHGRLVIEGSNVQDWIIINVQQTGYYRVFYDEENWKRLAAYLNSDDYHNIHPINRAQIIYDAMKFAIEKKIDMNILIDIMAYLTRETEYLPWAAANSFFEYINTELAGTEAHDTLKAYMLRILEPITERIGYEDRRNDDLNSLLLKRIVNYWSCRFGQLKCREYASQTLEKHLEEPKNYPLNEDVGPWVQCTGLNDANESIWSKMLNFYKRTPKKETLSYLGCSENPSILTKFLNFVMAPNSIVPQEQTEVAFRSTFVSRDNANLLRFIITFVTEHFDKIKLLFKKPETFINLLGDMASEIKQNGHLDMFKNLIKKGATFVGNKIDKRLKLKSDSMKKIYDTIGFFEPILKKHLNFFG